MDSRIASVAELAKSLEVRFDDLNSLNEAMVHRSYLNEHPESSLRSNERLEFLGDAVLGMAIAELLVQLYPDIREGELTRRRAALVRTETLAKVANELKLGDWLLLSKGESASGGRHQQRLLASAFEAIVGAIYLDQGIEQAKEFAAKSLDSYLNGGATDLGRKDPKSELQERFQATDSGVPAYEVIAMAGPDHAPMFTVQVRFGNRVIGRGQGSSKRKAEQRAAMDALKDLEEVAD